MFQGLTLHSKADPATFKDLRPHITRTVKWTPHGVYVPLFPKYLRQNDTLVGVEEAQVLMRRERARRKRLDVTDEQKQVYEKLDDMMTVTATSAEAAAKLGLGEQTEEPLTPTKEEEDVDQSEEMNKEVGKTAKIVGLRRRTKFNDKMVTVESWSEEMKLFTVRLQDLSTCLMVKRENLTTLDEEEEEKQRKKKEEVDDQMLSDGITRAVNGKHYRRTANGRWREVDAIFGLFIQKTSKRPEGIIPHMWKAIQRSKTARKGKVLRQMQEIVGKNLDAMIKDEEKQTKEGYKHGRLPKGPMRRIVKRRRLEKEREKSRKENEDTSPDQTPEAASGSQQMNEAATKSDEVVCPGPTEDVRHGEGNAGSDAAATDLALPNLTLPQDKEKTEEAEDKQKEDIGEKTEEEKKEEKKKKEKEERRIKRAERYLKRLMAEEEEQGAGPHESHGSALSVIQRLTQDHSNDKDDNYYAILGVGPECKERIGSGGDVSMIPDKVAEAVEELEAIKEQVLDTDVDETIENPR